MNSDKKLEAQINEYQQVAKENPKVDVGMLMLNALQNQKQNMVSPKTKKWAYLISVGVPPFGLLFALKYYFSDEDDAAEVMWTCIILTALAGLIFWITIKLFFSGSGASIQQIEQIKPADILELAK